MKRMMQGVVVAGALVMGGTSFAQGAKAGTAEYKGFMVPTDAKGMLERIHYANLQEIKQAELAQKTSQNPDVKAFAEQMITQHKDADQKVQTLAQSKKLKLADMPKPADDAEKKAQAADKADFEKLQSLKGDAFDGCYMAGQLGAHDAVLGKLAAGKQAGGADAELTALVDELSQSVAQHRQHAYTLLAKMAPGGNTMGGGTMGGGTTGGTMGGGTMGTPKPSTGGTMGGGTTGGTMGGTGTTGGTKK
jgi:putative membrane protein